MSKNKEKLSHYADKLKKSAENLNNSSNFSTEVTLSLDEHKMLIEGYKDGKFFMSKEYEEFEKCDLIDYFNLERKDGGTINQAW